MPLLPKLAQLQLGVSAKLDFVGIGAAAVQQLLPILRFLDGVTALNFTGNYLKAEDAQALLASVSSLTSLQQLN